MMRKYKKLLVIAGSLLLTAAIATTVIIAWNMQKAEAERVEKERLDNIEIERLSKRFDKDPEYIKAHKENLETWKEVEYFLLSEEVSFTSEETGDLIYSGYLREDIEKARELSVKSNVDKMKIIKARGIYPDLTSWKKIIKRFNLDVRSDAEKIGLKKADIKYLKDKGFTDTEIISVALMVRKNGNMKSIREKLESGKTMEELKREYGMPSVNDEGENNNGE